MKIHFHVVGEKQREHDVADAFGVGVLASGDEFTKSDAANFAEPDAQIDVACVFALKGNAKRILDAYHVMGARTLLFDKGLIRASTGLGAPNGYYRVSIDEFMPIGRIERMMREGVSPNRWVATGLRPRDRVRMTPTGPVIFAGSSQKYCDFHGLGDEHEYAEDICRRIRKKAGKDRPIFYRPKPSYGLARIVEGTIFSRPTGEPSKELHVGPLGDLLPKAHALVTHGSHAAIDAILAGVPAIVLGDGAARPVSGTDIEDLRDCPSFPDRERRFAWLSSIAWFQWRVPEMVDGTMWRFLREEMERPAA
jgi:hypothetical protein